MGNMIKLHNDITLYPGELIQARDKERKTYTLKYESITGNTVTFKQMGRNTVKMIPVDLDSVADFIHAQYKKVEKVLRF